MKIKVLVLEDRIADAEIVIHELRRSGYEPDWLRVDTASDFAGQLAGGYEIILADYQLPQFTALDALTILNQSGCDIPFIVITGTINEETAVACIKKGAADYLIKDRLARLGQAVQNALEARRLRLEKRQAEESLRDSERRYRALFEGANDAILIHDLHGHFLEVNQAACESLGYTHEELLRLTPADLDRDAFQRNYEIARAEINRRGFAVFEATHYRKDGTRFAVEVSARGLDYNGTPAVQDIVRNIEERKQANAALLESERRFRDMLDNVHLISLLLDVNGTVNYVNDYLLDMTGYTRDALTGVNWFDRMIPAGERERVRQVLLASLADGIILPHMINPILTRGGEQRIITWSNTVLHNAGGDVIGIASIGEDVTDQQKHVRELEVIAEVSAGLRGALSSARILPFVLNELKELLNADAGAIVLLDPLNDTPVIDLGSGHWANMTGRRLENTSDKFIRILGEGAPVVLRAGEESPCDLKREFEGEEIVMQPLVSQEVAVGVVCVGRREAFDDEELQLLAMVANMTAAVLHRASLFEETQRRLKHITTLHTIGLAMNGTLDLRIALSTLVEQMSAQLGVDAACILLLDQYTHTLTYSVGRGFHTKTVTDTRLHLGESLAGSAALNRRPVYVGDIRKQSTPHNVHLLIEDGFVSYYGIPLIAKGFVKGVLELFYRAETTINSEWEEFLATLAAEVALAIDNAELFESQQRSNIELSMAYDATIEGWSRALDLRDRETEGHTQRVSEMSLRLARAIGIREEELLNLRRGALLHDIGKMGVPDSILHKPGPLNAEESEIMRQHPALAFSLLSPIQFLRSALDVPYSHHERWDGNGYPQGLKGEHIPLAARVFAVVDVWDALLSDRPYRPAWKEEDVFDYIRAQSGKHFDPEVVRVFLALMGKG